jgi:2-polyprenyl-3-methyl-5-hydroxy-6-metoxy-1,4-benzoquinol methylase
MSDWNQDQEWEREWHGNCANSLNEELKQLVYAKKMGLKIEANNKTPFNFDLKGVSVLDIGGGPYSLLLKCYNFTQAIVADPCDYPEWVYSRYTAKKINFMVVPAEELPLNEKYDMVLIYNVLQHTKNPEEIIKRALSVSKELRIFEWIETGISKGHPINLTQKELDFWLNGKGKTEFLNESGCVGLSYYGIFKGKLFEEK